MNTLLAVKEKGGQQATLLISAYTQKMPTNPAQSCSSFGRWNRYAFIDQG